MSPEECVDKVRFKLSDETGKLRFKEFDIVDVLERREIADALRKHLVGRPLAEVDVDYLARLDCPGDRRCMRAIVNLVAQYRLVFTGPGGEYVKNFERSPEPTEGTS